MLFNNGFWNFQELIDSINRCFALWLFSSCSAFDFSLKQICLRTGLVRRDLRFVFQSAEFGLRVGVACSTSLCCVSL